MYDFLIAGAGIFGAVFACEAGKKGKTCLVIDERGNIGGNLYCENIHGIETHQYGAHIFRTDDREIWEYLDSLGEMVSYRGDSQGYSYEGVPFSGYTGIIARLLKDCNVYLNTEYEKFIKERPDVAQTTLYTGRLDDFFGNCYGRLEYEKRKYRSRVLYQEYYQRRAVEDQPEKTLRVTEHKHLTGIQIPLTVITEEIYGDEVKDGILCDLKETPENLERFRKYMDLASQEEHVLFGGRLSHEKRYTIAEAVRDARALAAEIV
nr:UDP-galactopyranose mutase [uncultured Blautia sp.]